MRARPESGMRMMMEQRHPEVREGAHGDTTGG